MVQLVKAFLMPPFVIARLGDSKTPIDAFDWAEDASLHGGSQTVIRAAVTLDVQPDGAVRARIPPVIQFRDGAYGPIRPTAPFLEVWGLFDDSPDPRPLTSTALVEIGGAIGHVTWQVSVANLKAARRTKDKACGFSAEVTVAGNDHAPKPLRASSPNVPGQQPLVFDNAPIPLGSFQVIRPQPGIMLGVELDVLRVRFTPATGEVYGPPAASMAQDPDAPSTSIAEYEIVPKSHRILNQAASWCGFVPSTQQDQPEPADTFDGVEDLPNGLGGQSWGVVDDTCDGIIRVVIEVGPNRYTASARVSAGPPDFAPDRRPFASLADDLADRELPALTPAQIADPETVDEVSDLLRRVFEAVSLTNLDALRGQMLRQNGDASTTVPFTDNRSMTQADAPLADQSAAIVGGTPGNDLTLTMVARDVHGPLADVDTMIRLFRTEGTRLKHLIRPPFAKFPDLPAQPVATIPTDSVDPGNVQVLAPVERDPRQARDGQHDMRMPPYMRDADAFPLSLSWRQYREVIGLIDCLAILTDEQVDELSPVRRHVARVLERRRVASHAAHT